MRVTRVVCLCHPFTWSLACSAQPLFDEFKTGHLDEHIWCPCQIETPPVHFLPDPDDSRDRIAAIIVDKASLGGNDCTERERERCGTSAGAHSIRLEDVDEAPESLGPSLVRPAVAGMLARENRFCTPEIRKRAETREEKKCIQRQELRLQEIHRHKAVDAYWYALRFRMPEADELDRSNSIRWVTAQWKHTEVDKQTYKDWSPFLAQRFDDGVLHVTVQDEYCRCNVASARIPSPVPPDACQPWENWTPDRCCRSSRRGDPEGQRCENKPGIEVKYGRRPAVLPAALGRWVELKYRVQAGRSGRAVIEVCEDDRLIVRVSGNIGYKTQRGREDKTKFKIGHYRDYMPHTHVMGIDRVRIQRAKKIIDLEAQSCSE